MDVQQIKADLEQKYPGKKIVVNDPENPTEIICEIEPASPEKNTSVQIAVIDESVKHVHQNTTELYEVIHGDLTITKDGKEYVMKVGESFAVHPNEEHSIEGHETWIKITSIPAWNDKAHTPVNEQ